MKRQNAYVLPASINEGADWLATKIKVEFIESMTEVIKENQGSDVTAGPVVVTGANGTVGRALLEVAEEQNRADQIVKWDRAAVPPDNTEACRKFMEETAPSGIIHLAIPSQSSGMEDEGHKIFEAWPRLLAEWTAEHGVKLLVISTVMVWTDEIAGPFTPETPPNAADGYGSAKKRTEEVIFEANPQARIARIGWQIGEESGSNNMYDFLETKQREEGKISPSALWYPATSFLPDTADALWQIYDRELAEGEPRVFLCDSNQGWNFAEIITALNALHDGRWTVEPADDYSHDQQMIDPRVKMPSLSLRLPELKPAMHPNQ